MRDTDSAEPFPEPGRLHTGRENCVYRTAIFCSNESTATELLDCLRSYQYGHLETELSYSLYYTLKSMEAAVQAEGAFDLYILSVEENDLAALHYAKALGNGKKEPELILLFRREEYLRQIQVEFPQALLALWRDSDAIFDVLKQAEERLSDGSSQVKSIGVATSQGKELVAYSEIIYIEYRQKRLVFHLTGDRQVTSRTIRQPMEDFLFPMLEDPRFVRTHSAFIVNAERAIKLEKNSFLMESGATIPVSKLRSKTVYRTWKNVMTSDLPRPAHVNSAIRYCESRKTQLEYIRRQPFAQCIIRVDVNSQGEPFDFVFMYVNEALCHLEGKSKELLLGASFYDVFSNADPKWLPKYYETAYQGKSQSFESYSPEIDKLLSITCYQTEPGYCGCILMVSGARDPMEYVE